MKFEEWIGDRIENMSSHEYAAEKAAWDAAIQASRQEPLEYWNAVEGWVQLNEVQEHFDSVGCGTIYKNAGEGRMPLYSAPSVPEGYVLVPVEPTEKMIEAGYNAFLNSGWIRTYEIYEAMIQAAQEEE